MNEAMKPPQGLFDCHMCGVKCTPVEIELSLDKYCVCTECNNKMRAWNKSVVKHC